MRVEGALGLYMHDRTAFKRAIKGVLDPDLNLEPAEPTETQRTEATRTEKQARKSKKLTVSEEHPETLLSGGRALKKKCQENKFETEEIDVTNKVTKVATQVEAAEDEPVMRAIKRNTDNQNYLVMYHGKDEPVSLAPDDIRMANSREWMARADETPGVVVMTARSCLNE